MADIRIRELPTASPAVPTDFVALDNGTTRKVTISDLVNVGRPLASQAEAEAGTEAAKAMTPLTTAQAIVAQGSSLFASAAEGLLASTALQPSAIGVTVASAAQGAKADTALQPADIGVSVGNMLEATYDPANKAADAFDPLNFKDALTYYGAVGDGVTDDSAAVTAALATGLLIDGKRKTYKVSSVPADFSDIKRAAFKVGSITYLSRDFLRTDTAKITNNFLYTGWAEVKSYLVGDSLRVWALEKESHADGTGRILCFTSDDGGSTYSPGEYLDLAASGRTLWSAGYSGTTEYLIVRVPAGSLDTPPYTYERWHRTVTTDTSGNLNTTPWTVTAITFPTPVGFTGQPIMVIDFATGHGGSIVVGTSYGEGAAVARSTDGGGTWTSYILGASSSFEEPTVRYDATTQRYYGFIRNGTDGQNPRFWNSGVDDLTTISLWTAPAGTFGTNGLSDSPIPFAIKDGRIHGFASYRNGTLEGSGSDELTSAFYLDMPVFAGNIWSQATANIYRLGTLPHRETGGASAVGVGAVVIQDDKVHLIYGMEERTGAISSLNRITNLYQTIIFLTDRNGMFDFRNDVVVNRAATYGLGRQPKNGGFTYYAGDTAGGLPALFGGRVNFRRDPAQNVIAGGRPYTQREVVFLVSGRH
ncbi:hypothetical protein [Sinorhizobium medicae]